MSITRKAILLLSLLLAVAGCSTIKPSMEATPSLMNALGMAEMPLKDLEKRYVTEQSQFIEIEGLDVHYRDVGEGPTVILIHGIMSSLHTWNGWVDELQSSYRVIALDLPGYGMTGAPENIDDFDIEYLNRMLAKFIDYLELDKVSLAGNSMGGYLAARYAADNPDRVERLILLDPMGYPHEQPWVFGLATTPGLNLMTKFVQPPFLVTMNVRQVYGDPRRLSKSNHERYIHMAQRPGAKAVYLKTLQMLSQKDEEGNLLPLPLAASAIRTPTLLMWGEEDRWIPVSDAELWKKDLRNVQYISYPGVGHVPMEEMPYQTAQDAIAFLADLNPSGPAQPSIEELEDLLKGEDFSGGFGEMEGF